MKKVLIPTDFSVESLQLVEYAIVNNPNTDLRIVLVAGYKQPDNRWALTHFIKSEVIHKKLSDDYIVAKRSLMREHACIKAISFDLFTGKNSIAFQNFLEIIEIEDTIVPKNNFLKCDGSKWFDITKYIKKNAQNVTEVLIETSMETPHQKFSLNNLLNL